MIGGFLLGAVNALLVGATLSLIEQSILSARALDIPGHFGSFGHYFWDVIGIGFVLWLPLMALDLSMQTNPYGQLISYARFLLIFLLLNPAPEIIYQVRHDSPLEVLKTSYEFVLENWIEWFLPFARHPDPHRPLADGTAIVFFSLQPSREGGRFGFFPDPRVAIHDPWRLARLCGDSFFNQLVSRAAASHHRLPWPCCCFVAISLHPYTGCHDANANLSHHSTVGTSRWQRVRSTLLIGSCSNLPALARSI